MVPPTKNKKENQHIRVFVRVRPMSKQEMMCNASQCLDILSKSVAVHAQYGSKAYNFDRVFGVESKQCEVYTAVVSRIVDDVMQGYNNTVFMYGQSGTGKTFTMIGNSMYQETSYSDDCDVGIVPRVMDHLFQKLSNNGDVDFSVRVSYLELYNEVIIDLLSNEEKKLKIYEDKRCKGSVQIHGLEEITLYDKHQIYSILLKGNERRGSVSSLANFQSNRSHTIFSIIVHTREATPSGEQLIKTGKLYLVDLASSESVSKVGNSDKTVREAGVINQSLNSLGRVIKALAEKNTHIPYRESKLTRILQDSLGGKTKTSIIATVSPASSNREDTVNTLDYIARARNIINTPEINTRTSKTALIELYLDEMERLKKDVYAARTNTGFFVDPENYDMMIKDSERTKDELLKSVEECSNLEGRAKELERVKNELHEVYSVAHSELVEATASLAKTKISLEHLRAERHIRQEHIDKYDDAQTMLRQHTKALSNALDKYTKEHQVLHEKLTKLYRVNDKNENTSLGLLNSYKAEHSKLNKQFNDLLKQVHKRIKEIELTFTEIVNINNRILAKYDSVSACVNDAAKSIANKLITHWGEIISIFNNWDSSSEQGYSVLIEIVETSNKKFSMKLQPNFDLLKDFMVKYKNDNQLDLCMIQNKHKNIESRIKTFMDTVREEIKTIQHRFFELSKEFNKQLIDTTKFGNQIDQSLHGLEDEIFKDFSQINSYVCNEIGKFSESLSTKLSKHKDYMQGHGNNLTESFKVQENIEKCITGTLAKISTDCLNANKFVNDCMDKIDADSKIAHTLSAGRVEDMLACASSLIADVKQYSDMFTDITSSTTDMKPINQNHSNALENVLNEYKQDCEQNECIKEYDDIVNKLDVGFGESFKTVKNGVSECRIVHNKESKHFYSLLAQFSKALITAKSKGDTPNGKRPVLTANTAKRILKSIFVDCDRRESSDEE